MGAARRATTPTWPLLEQAGRWSAGQALQTSLLNGTWVVFKFSLSDSLKCGPFTVSQHGPPMRSQYASELVLLPPISPSSNPTSSSLKELPFQRKFPSCHYLLKSFSDYPHFPQHKAQTARQGSLGTSHIQPLPPSQAHLPPPAHTSQLKAHGPPAPPSTGSTCRWDALHGRSWMMNSFRIPRFCFNAWCLREQDSVRLPRSESEIPLTNQVSLSVWLHLLLPQFPPLQVAQKTILIESLQGLKETNSHEIFPDLCLPHWGSTPVILEKTRDHRRWGKCGEKGALVHYWWGWKLVQPLRKTVRRFLKKLKSQLPNDPAIPLLGTHPKKTKTLTRKGICTPVFIVAFTVDETWKQPEWP